MVGVSLMFLISIVTVLAIISLSVFFIIFGIMKKMKGFIIVSAALLILFVACIVMFFMLNFMVIR